MCQIDFRGTCLSAVGTVYRQGAQTGRCGILQRAKWFSRKPSKDHYHTDTNFSGKAFMAQSYAVPDKINNK
jgi:hypothetical protein